MTTQKTSQAQPASPFPWQQSVKFSLQPFLNFNDVTTLYHEMMKENLNALNECTKCNIEFIQELSKAKELNEIINAQKNWASKISPQWYQYMQHMQEIMLKMTKEYNQHWLSALHSSVQKKH